MRLGHAPLRVLRIIGSLNPMEFHDDQCIVCPIVKKSRLPSPLSNSLPLCASDIVHVDLWGPYKVPNHHGKIFFMTLVDDFSRFIWIFSMINKSDSIVILRDFIVMIKN